MGRAAFLELIRRNIATHGYHVTSVASGGQTPRWMYTIGLTEIGRPELVLAGAVSLLLADAQAAIDAVVQVARRDQLTAGQVIEVEGLGAFRLEPVDSSWARLLALGVFDVYGSREPGLLQLVPQGPLWTIDVPALSTPHTPDGEPVWRYLTEPWDLDIPETAIVATDLHALRGRPLIEASRWEPDDWEAFSAEPDPHPDPDDHRWVPLTTLVGFDTSAVPIAKLEVGQSIRRTPPGPWEPWDRS